MKVLVTGGTGFIGTHLVRKLIDEKNEVRCLVRKNSNTDFLKETGVEIVFGNITDKDSLKDVTNGVDIVYHLASLVDHKHSKTYEEHYNVSVVGTENLVKDCFENKIKKFVYISSIAAVGIRNTKELINEKSECKPITAYGKAKLETEKMVLNYLKNDGFPVNIIRPPVIYGEGTKDGSILSLARFINFRAKKNQPYPFFDHGSNLTSLCYVKNLADGIVLVGKSKNIGETYHIADARPYSIKEMVGTISDSLNAELKTFSVPKKLIWIGSLAFEPLKMIGLNPPLYMRKYVEMTANFAYDILKIKSIGYNPEDNFKKFISNTVNWQKENKLLD